MHWTVYWVFAIESLLPANWSDIGIQPCLLSARHAPSQCPRGEMPPSGWPVWNFAGVPHVLTVWFCAPFGLLLCVQGKPWGESKTSLGTCCYSQGDLQTAQSIAPCIACRRCRVCAIACFQLHRKRTCRQLHCLANPQGRGAAY